MEQLKNLFFYFFGKGDTVEFRHFSFMHLLPILTAGVVLFLIIFFRKQLKECKHEKVIRMTLAFVAIVTEMAYFWRMACLPELGGNAQEHLPITVCGWAVVFCSYLAVTKSQSLFDIAYFWVFSGTIFGLLTPTVITYTGPTRFRFYQFWLEHTIGYFIIFYMMFVHKMRPNWKSIVKSASALSILLVIAVFFNTMLGSPANYLFVAELEETTSVLNLLPSNIILKILVMATIIGIMFFLSYLPWLIIDIRAKKKRLAAEGAPIAEETVSVDTTVEEAPVPAEDTVSVVDAPQE